MDMDIILTEDFVLDADTNDAASALTYLRVLNDINEAVDYPEAVKYLKLVQAKSGGEQFVSFVGALREFQEEVVREINEKKDFLIKCALTLFPGHTDILVGLGDYIPEILDALEPDQSEDDQHHHHHDPTNTPITPMDQSSDQERPSQQESPSIASDWQAEASLLWQHVHAQEAREAFLAKVQKRFLHSDHTSCMKIYAILQAFLVDMSMDMHTAKEEMSTLLQRHNDLWKEFESFLPPPLRAGPSSSQPLP